MINHPQKRQLAAFTLIEILVTVSLTALIMMGITSLFISFIVSAGKSRLSQSVRENGSVAMQKIIEELRNAKSINLALQTGGCDGSTVHSNLSFVNADETPSELRGINNRIALIINHTAGTQTYNLTSDTNYLRDLEFVCYNTESAQYIEISFTLASSEATSPSANHSQLDFKSGVTLRN